MLAVIAWTLYNHSHTGFWTGNAQYLQYNIYSTLNPVRFMLSLARRLYQILLGGFNWVLAVGAVLGMRWSKARTPAGQMPGHELPLKPLGADPRGFLSLGAGLCAVYVLFHSIGGGALLRRYLLPVFPVFYLGAIWFIWNLPKRLARACSAAAAVLFVAGWFLNGSYSFEFEANLAYADFIHLHRDSARYLEERHERRRILTAWPASGELTEPILGYVGTRLSVVPVDDFGERSFRDVRPVSFDLLYLYSRKSESVRVGLMRFPLVQQLNQRYFDYVPQVPDQILTSRFHLKLLRSFERHGQWVRIYSR